MSSHHIAAAPAPVALFRASFAGIERWLFAAACVAAASIHWLAPRLPMVDLPQHAAQVGLWRDLLLGQSAFADVVHVNLFTPYLIGYGLTLPLSFVFTLDVSVRIVLTLAFAGFVAGSIALRRAFDADHRLDWLCLLPFFGFCWKLGFFTFLVASPLGLFFILLAHHQARVPSFARGAALTLAGAALLFAHGLMFLASGFLGGLLMLDQMATRRDRVLARLAPYAALALTTLAFRMISREIVDAPDLAAQFWFGTPIWQRPPQWLLHIGDMENAGGPWLKCAALGALSAPFLLGLKRNQGAPAVLLTGLIVLMCLLPSEAFATSMLHQRFALLLPPFMAWMFRRAAPEAVESARARAGLTALIACCGLFLALQAVKVVGFARESRSFETVLAAAQPGKRALSVIFDRASAAAANNHAYLHYPAWYQAEKRGFVDFNFAIFHPQVVRFNPGQAPRAGEIFTPDLSTWSEIDLPLYDYLFVRGEAGEVEAWTRGAPCPLETIARDEEWRLLRRGSCGGR